MLSQFPALLDYSAAHRVPILAEDEASWIWTDSIVKGRAVRQCVRLTRLPPYLILHIKRVTTNNFFLEKNPTIVNYPIVNLDLAPFLSQRSIASGGSKPPPQRALPAQLRYNLLANICHETSVGGSSTQDTIGGGDGGGGEGGGGMRSSRPGPVVPATSGSGSGANKGQRRSANRAKSMKPGSERARRRFAGGAGIEAAGTYRVHVLHDPGSGGGSEGKADGNGQSSGGGGNEGDGDGKRKGGKQWYEIQDLFVRETQPLEIGMSETELLFFKRQGAQ